MWKSIIGRKNYATWKQVICFKTEVDAMLVSRGECFSVPFFDVLYLSDFLALFSLLSSWHCTASNIAVSGVIYPGVCGIRYPLVQKLQD